MTAELKSAKLTILRISNGITDATLDSCTLTLEDSSRNRCTVDLRSAVVRNDGSRIQLTRGVSCNGMDMDIGITASTPETAAALAGALTGTAGNCR